MPRPLLDPKTHAPLAPREQPGYYPGFSTLGQQAYWDATTRDLVLTRVLTAEKPLRFFTAKEAETLGAVMARVLPQEDRVESRRIPLLPALDERLSMGRIDGYRFEDMPSDGEAYHIAARGFEAMAQQLHGKSFAELETREQEELIQSIHDGKPVAAQAIWKEMNVERFWSMLGADCCGAYYAHPWAWDEIGFGGPAYPRGYMRLENGEAEPWEVGEQRYEWAPPDDTLSGKEQKQGQGGEHQVPASQGGTH